MVNIVHAELRPMVEDDLDLVLTWRNHTSVRNYMFTRHVISEQEHRNWFESSASNQLQRHFIFMLEQVPSGFVSFKLTSERSSIAYWGFYRAPNISVGTRNLLGETSLDYATYQLNLTKLYAEVVSFNIRSVRFLERLGFNFENKVRRGSFDGTDYDDVLIMGKSLKNLTAQEAH